MRQIITIVSLIIVCCSFAQTIDSIPNRLIWDKTNTNTKALKALLSNPLNLLEYKKTKPLKSNSGGANKQVYFYRPNYDGLYYFYFAFNHFNLHGPRITTYKKGNRVGGYMDSSEVFIQLACDRIDKDLGKVNILSMSTAELLNTFGNNYLKRDDFVIYQHNKTILIICLKESDRWFKITRLNKAFSDFEQIQAAKDLLLYL